MKLRQKLSQFVHVPWTWFMQPIISTGDQLDRFGYQAGDCPISEKVGPNMVNLPCNITVTWAEKMVDIFQNLYKA